MFFYDDPKMRISWNRSSYITKNHNESLKKRKNLISRWVRVIIFYNFFLWIIFLWKYFFINFVLKFIFLHQIFGLMFYENYVVKSINIIYLVVVYFGEYTWPVAFELTYLQCLTHSRSWDIWIDVRVVFRWFQPYWFYLF